jgi:hypothetical protein
MRLKHVSLPAVVGWKLSPLALDMDLTEFLIDASSRGTAESEQPDLTVRSREHGLMCRGRNASQLPKPFNILSLMTEVP